MKNIYIIISVSLIFFMLLLPLFAFKSTSENGGENSGVNLSNISTHHKTEEFKVLNTNTGKIENISRSDYLEGVVAAEMPAMYNEEAIKAQAVAAYTFALYRKNENKDKDYDITDSELVDQKYITISEAREKWGENADLYQSKIKNAVKSVEGEYIAFNKEPILALYHAISGGKTESCLSVFGQDLPYLTERDSSGDLFNENYISLLNIPCDEFAKKLSSTVNFSDDTENWISNITYRSNGYVESVTICEKLLSGIEIRKYLGLRSANFDVSYNDGTFNFTVRGYGHGVGLSQYGAEYMANQGGTYTEILKWYYANCEILKQN